MVKCGLFSRTHVGCHEEEQSETRAEQDDPLGLKHNKKLLEGELTGLQSNDRKLTE